MAMHSKNEMKLYPTLCSGKKQCEPLRRRSRGSFNIRYFMTLLTVVLCPVKRSGAFLFPTIPRYSLPGSLQQISPTALFWSKSTAPRTTHMMSLSRYQAIEETEAVQTSISMEQDLDMSLSETALSFHGDDSDDRDTNSTLPSHLFSRLPPFRIEDWNLLLYDIFLIVNLSVSISFWVIHRYDVTYIGRALNEGCLLSILWIGAGLWNGSFLYSSVDGHYPPPFITNRRANRSSNHTNNSVETNQGGPMAAGLLAFHTFINTINLRLLFALIVAVVEHRPALSSGTELLVPLELGYGLILMILWRALHSSFVFR
jgi:hypothetical protein